MGGIGKIGILGGGSWATALAKIVLSTQKEINWYMRRSEQVDEFKKIGHNPTYLPSAEFDTSRIHFYTDPEVNSFLRACDTVVLVTPSPYFKGVMKRVRKSSLRGKFIVNAIKGVVPDEHMLISEYMEKEFDVPKERVAIIGGPCHAEEVARGRRSYLTVAGIDPVMTEEFAQVMRNDFVSCVTTKDVIGVQYSSVLKNIYAIASGIAMGLMFGDNFQSVLMSNAIAEMNNFLYAIHLVDRVITDSVYLGDLLVTAYSQHSRNRTFGNMIGRGYSVRSAQMEMEMVAVGYYAAKSMREINRRYQLNMPIMETVYQILYERRNPREAMLELGQSFK